ncbi:GNAT family N-acetyltransferase [Allomuricauda sp. R78024]|uniref:GNAT family N-acetyltransferase n=1 Tax=Allomuricauda sp. R78024 TaxID=3093867 RepID=UPI0037C8A746
MKLKRLNFYFELFEKGRVIPHYESIRNNTNNKIIYGNKTFSENGNSEIVVVGCVPPYFDIKINKEDRCNAFEIPSRLGFMANLEGYSNVDDYMKDNLKRQRKQINRKIRRLEQCFDISYKSYYGEIKREEYDMLFDSFRLMIQKRFSQKGMQHEGLKRWKEYKQNVYDLILLKKATLFTICVKDKPIAISLGYNYQNILVSTICSYDIDYAKFGLGQIDTVKNVEWCLNNGFDRYDMMWGDLRYKREWSNVIFTYKSHIIYCGASIGKMATAYVVGRLAVLKKLLSAKKSQFFSWKLISSLQREKAPLKDEDFKLQVQAIPIDNIVNRDELLKLNIEELQQYSFLREKVYDFQYINFEHSSSTQVYKASNNTYFIEGKSNKMKLEYTKSPMGT